MTAVPAFHPEHDTFRPLPVHVFVVHHPDGPIIVDTGIGFGNDLIDARYPHTSQRLLDELTGAGGERGCNVVHPVLVSTGE